MAPPSDVWLAAGRIDSFRYTEIDRATMQPVRDITAITEPGGTVGYNALTQTKASAKLRVTGDLGVGANYIRVTAEAEAATGSASHILGTFIPTVPATDYTDTARSGGVECASLLQLLADTALEEPLALEAGADPVGAAALLCAGAGLAVVADPSAYLLAAPRVYDAGTCCLEAVNDLLGIAGFDSAGVDAAGCAVFSRYRDPSALAPQLVLDCDVAEAFISPEMAHEFDASAVPNKVIAVASQPDEAPLVAVAVNDDPLSAFSTVSRGRVVAHVEDVSDCDSLEALQDAAARLLAQKSSAVESLEITHPFLPYGLGDAVRVVSARQGVDFTGAAVSKEVALTPGMPCKVRLRRFVRM
jgi:hypothetical protein